MNTKTVTYSDEYNDMPQPLDYKWWFDTNMFWVKNKMTGFKPDNFMRIVEERYINNGEVTREQAQRDLDILNRLAGYLTNNLDNGHLSDDHVSDKELLHEEEKCSQEAPYVTEDALVHALTTEEPWTPYGVSAK